MIEKVQLLDFIFEKKTSRTELMQYTPVFAKKEYKISIYRNHSFELISKIISPFLDLAEIKVNFEYSDYDDSLSFFNLDLESDLIILWLDLSRYNEYESFIKERLAVLKKQYTKNVLFVPFEGDINIQDSQICVYDIDKWKESLGVAYIDERLERFSGTKMSMSTCEAVARDLGLNYLPALLQPNLKCIVVDLDNTLYKGVLGEDGVEGVQVSEDHIHLQIQLKKLAENGIFLCIASKNDKKDVLDMLAQRKDFPLKASDFSCIEANWDSKASSIMKFERILNISSNSFLFIDDNMGELLSVCNEHPEIKIIHAKDDASVTLNALKNYPGLLKLSVNKEDAIRKSDTQANAKRQEILNSVSKEEYIKSLNMELIYSIDDNESIDRISELSNKTNQFIFSYQRYSKAEVARLMSSNDSTIVAVSLKDKLSDSGIIAVVSLKKIDDEFALLEECFVSCRALGRGIDNEIVFGSIKQGMDKLSVSKLLINYKIGERNNPAINFIENNFKEYTEIPREFDFLFPQDILKISTKE
ncbi:HAD-IIIC family phosphatase [Vibrio cholerae]